MRGFVSFVGASPQEDLSEIIIFFFFKTPHTPRGTHCQNRHNLRVGLR